MGDGGACARRHPVRAGAAELRDGLGLADELRRQAARPAFVPITFETMVFWAALGSAVVAVIAGKIDTVPQPPPSVTTGATADRFVLWISATDPKWQGDQASQFVRSLGADDVRLVDAGGDGHV
jgi:hypothetical protein